MRVQGLAITGLVLGMLAACATPPPATEPGPTETATPSPPHAETVPPGEPAIPAGCGDLLAVSDVADLGADADEPLSAAIHEDRIVVAMASVAALQTGTLHCIWASRYGSTDFHASIDLRIAPTTQTALDPADEESFYDAFAPLDGDPQTLIACDESSLAVDDSTLFNGCQVVQLRGGYRVELDTNSLEAGPGRDQTVARQLMATIDVAIDAAGPARDVLPAPGTTDPASLCRSPEVAPLLERLGATGEPTIAPHPETDAVTQCTWPGVDEYGQPIGPWVEVLPGGAWAMPRLATGVASIFLPTHPSSDGTFLVGVGDAVSAWRTAGDDLVMVVGGDYRAVEGWEEFLERTW